MINEFAEFASNQIIAKYRTDHAIGEYCYNAPLDGIVLTVSATMYNEGIPVNFNLYIEDNGIVYFDESVYLADVKWLPHDILRLTYNVG